MKVFDKGFSLTWLGHSAFHLVSPRGRHLLVDPWLEGNPMAPVGDSPITHVDAILVTHARSEEHTSELQSLRQLVCRLLLEKKNTLLHSAIQESGHDLADNTARVLH